MGRWPGGCALARASFRIWGRTATGGWPRPKPERRNPGASGARDVYPEWIGAPTLWPVLVYVVLDEQAREASGKHKIEVKDQTGGAWQRDLEVLEDSDVKLTATLLKK